MKWTKTKPTKVGFYWYKDGLCDLTIGEVTQDLRELWFNDNRELIFKIGKGKEDDETRWAGPIEEPNE